MNNQETHLAAALVLLDLLGVEVDTALITSSSRLSFHSSLDLARHREEGLFHVGARLGRRFQKFDAERVRKLLTLLGANHSFSCQIGLVADQKLVDVFRCVSVNFVQPLLHVRERFSIRHVVYDNNSVRTTVIGRSNGSETLLSCGIPNLELDCLSVQVDGADFLGEIKENVSQRPAVLA